MKTEELISRIDDMARAHCLEKSIFDLFDKNNTRFHNKLITMVAVSISREPQIFPYWDGYKFCECIQECKNTIECHFAMMDDNQSTYSISTSMINEVVAISIMASFAIGCNPIVLGCNYNAQDRSVYVKIKVDEYVK